MRGGYGMNGFKADLRVDMEPSEGRWYDGVEVVKVGEWLATCKERFDACD